MPLAVTHVLLTIIAIDIFRHAFKKKELIPLGYLLIGGIAGLLPDIDIPFFWLLSFFRFNLEWFHGTFTHILLIPFVILIACLITYRYNKKAGILLGIITFGYGFHIILDFIFYGTNLSPLWPFFITQFNGVTSYLDIRGLEMGLDAFILLGWLWYEEIRHKIDDFI
jgi:membrane-bound metal-dependent hydrolase YbcI (DUF457 family)